MADFIDKLENYFHQIENRQPMKTGLNLAVGCFTKILYAGERVHALKNRLRDRVEGTDLRHPPQCTHLNKSKWHHNPVISQQEFSRFYQRQCEQAYDRIRYAIQDKPITIDSILAVIGYAAQEKQNHVHRFLTASQQEFFLGCVQNKKLSNMCQKKQISFLSNIIEKNMLREMKAEIKFQLNNDCLDHQEKTALKKLRRDLPAILNWPEDLPENSVAFRTS